MEQEAAALRARFAGVNRAAFAREHAIKGGQALIYQHINAVRPISLEAAKAYAKGFGVGLEDISPRLALEVRSAAPYATGGSTMRVAEPAAAYGRPRQDWPFSVPREDFEKLRPADKAALDKTLSGFVAGTLASYSSNEKNRDSAVNHGNEKKHESDNMAALRDELDALEQVAEGSESHGRPRKSNSRRGGHR
ncbi:hypothetical protein [Bordetella genomosp. 11]|uniref:hypothetical protein n=1 Tax=Bordetella genomosp. 11 TaxID=1416808 RepID=UPI0015957BF9|nr:hypothetical protein [Bordetella genomosp. 11]